MIQYIHHVPGRLRLSAKVFRCNAVKTQNIAAMLEAITGVTSVTTNPRAGSITIHYDPDQCTRLDLLNALERFGCSGNLPQPEKVNNDHVGALFGKALVGALAQRTASSLIGALL